MGAICTKIRLIVHMKSEHLTGSEPDRNPTPVTMRMRFSSV